MSRMKTVSQNIFFSYTLTHGSRKVVVVVSAGEGGVVVVVVVLFLSKYFQNERARV